MTATFIGVIAIVQQKYIKIKFTTLVVTITVYKN